ncbi:MAG: hypothetical protein IJ915_08090 [Paludibacteraceae bacterium]|nr:hypothetical protein [Paludibacteraceae bacterium]
MRREILTFLLFVVLAALMWYGHAMQSVRNTRVPVIIQYTGKPGAIGLGGKGLPDTVMIEVRDAGARLNAYHRDHLRLTIDLRSYIHGDKGTIHVPSDALRRSISDILQGTSRLIETAPEEITCPYFTEQEKSVPVVLAADIIPANEYQMVGEPTLSHTRLKIYGQDKAINRVDTLYTEARVLTEVCDTAKVRLALDIPAEMRAERDSVDLCIITERFTEKKFTIPVHIANVPAGYTMRLFPPEVDVNVRVGISHFADVQANDLRAVCVYSPEWKDKLDVELHYTNPFITAAWTYPAAVEYLLIEQ